MIRFRNGAVQFYRGHWRDVPMGLVAGLIAALGVGAYAALVHGPAWAGIPALLLILAVPVITLALLVWSAGLCYLERSTQSRRRRSAISDAGLHKN